MSLGPSMKRELSYESTTQWHNEMLNFVRNYVDASFASISEFYCRWDKAKDSYDAEAPGRTKDELATEEERPASQSIPVTYAQVQTFKAFSSSVLSQRPRQFEHAPGGPEDSAMIELSEVLLEQDLTENRWLTKRGQALQCLGLFGLGVLYTCWKADKVGLVFEGQAEPTYAFGKPWSNGKKIEAQEVTTWMGNDIQVISPYRYLPDPAYDMCDQHKARFQGHEFEISRQELKMLEANGEVAGIDYIANQFPDERWTRRDRNYKVRYDHYKQDNKQTEVIVITSLQLRLIPAQVKLTDGTTLGDLNCPTIVNVWMANDCRIIKCEISGHYHGQFSYDVAAFDNEKHTLLGKSIAEVMEKLQETTDWFMNSKIETVTRNVQPQLIVDPYAVEIGDIVNDERLIRLKKGAARFGMDAIVKQLDIRDTTAGHMDDIQQCKQLVYEVTGVNANMSGQFHTGRRSATEAKVVSGGAASRIMTILAEIWQSLFAPCGHKCNTNLRQGLTPEYIELRAGQRDQNIVAAYKADPMRLATSRDIWILDATTPTEKSFQAQWLQEVFGVIMSNPMAALQLDLSPRLILEKGMELQGIQFREDLRMSKDPQTLMMVVQQMAQQLATQMLAQQQSAALPAPNPVAQ